MHKHTALNKKWNVALCEWTGLRKSFHISGLTFSSFEFYGTDVNSLCHLASRPDDYECNNNIDLSSLHWFQISIRFANTCPQLRFIWIKVCRKIAIQQDNLHSVQAHRRQTLYWAETEKGSGREVGRGGKGVGNLILFCYELHCFLPHMQRCLFRQK